MCDFLTKIVVMYQYPQLHTTNALFIKTFRYLHIVYYLDTILQMFNKHCQIMTTIAYRILKFQTMIKKPIVTNHPFLAVATFSKIICFYIQF